MSRGKMGEIFFGFFHPVITVRWAWFLLVTDRKAFAELKTRNPEMFKSVQEHVIVLLLHVQFRRLRWAQDHLFSEGGQYARVEKCTHVDVGLVNYYRFISAGLTFQYFGLADELISLGKGLRDGAVPPELSPNGLSVSHLDGAYRRFYCEARQLYKIGQKIERQEARAKKKVGGVS